MFSGNQSFLGCTFARAFKIIVLCISNEMLSYIHQKILTATCCSGKIIYNYLYPSHSNRGNIQVVHIYLSGRHHDVNNFYPQVFVSLCQNKDFQGCLCLVFLEKKVSGLFLDNKVAASSTATGCLYHIELNLDRLSLFQQ